MQFRPNLELPSALAHSLRNAVKILLGLFNIVRATKLSVNTYSCAAFVILVFFAFLFVAYLYFVSIIAL